MKHNFINDEIELDFDPGKRINSYIKMLENMDLNQQEELYYTSAVEMMDWMHQDLIDKNINGSQYEKILEKYVYKIMEENQ